MPASIARRGFLAAPLLALPAFANDATSQFAELEHRYGGRLGVAALDTASGRRVEHRADERFPLCSTFKLLAAALVLARVDRGEERLDRRVVFGDKDLVTYSPVTKKQVGPRHDDRGAVRCRDHGQRQHRRQPVARELRRAGRADRLRALAGRRMTRLDRIETELNEATPGDPRDTTTPPRCWTPRACCSAMRCRRPRAAAHGWLVANTTGDRACAPACRRLAGRRQDRQRRQRHRQRRGHPLAARPGADPRRGLL